MPIPDILHGEKNILTPDDVARIMDTSRRAVLENKKLPRHKIGKHVRFSRKMLEAYIAKQEYNPEIDMAFLVVHHFEHRPVTVGGLSRLFRVWYRDMKAANPPMKWPTLIEWLCDNAY